MGGGTPWIAGTEFRPGIIPLRPLLLGDIFGGVIKAVRGNVPATMGLALLVCLAAIVPTTALGTWLASGVSFSFEEPDQFSGSGGVAAFDLAGLFGTYVPTLGVMVASIFLVGFMAYVIGQAVLGRKVGAGETWEGARGAIWRIVGATLLISVAFFGTVVALLTLPVAWLVIGSPSGGELAAAIGVTVIASILALLILAFLATRLALVTPPIVLERLGVLAALRRSWALTRRGFWRIFGIRLLTGLIVGIIAQVLTMPITLIGVIGVVATGNEAHLLTFQALLAGLAGLISATLTTPFTAGVDALLYVDQRIRLEALDVQLISASQSAAPPPWPRAGS